MKKLWCLIGVVILALCALAVRDAAAQTVTLRYAHMNAPSSIAGQQASMLAKAIEEKTKGQSRSTCSPLAARDSPGAGRGRQLRYGTTPPQHHGRHRVALRAVRSPGHPLHVQGRGAPDAGCRSNSPVMKKLGEGS